MLRLQRSVLLAPQPSNSNVPLHSVMTTPFFCNPFMEIRLPPPKVYNWLMAREIRYTAGGKERQTIAEETKLYHEEVSDQVIDLRVHR
jgi:hypothetical protein